MKDENARIRERERGRLAQLVTDNAVYQQAWADMEANLRAHMESSSSADDTVLEARRMLIALRRLRRTLEDAMTTGKMAEIQMDNDRGQI